MARFQKQMTTRLIAGAVAIVCAGSAWAEPLTLSANHEVLYDSNFARTENRISNTINATSLGLDLNKAYGRQVYTGSAKITALRYSHFGDVLNNDAKDLNLGFNTELLSNWRVILDGGYGQNLNQLENNRVTNHVVRNIRTNKNASAQVIYGISGIWALVGTAGKNTLGYSLPAYQSLNYHQDVRGVKAVYYSTDLLNYSVGVRDVETRYLQIGEKVNEHDLDFATDWVVSGLSQLNATVSLTSSKRETPVTSVVSDRHFSGLTGNLNWIYTPHGLLSYGVNLYRAANSDQYDLKYFSLDPSNFGINTGQQAYHNRITAANLYVKWPVTSKVTFTASTAWNHFVLQNDLIGGSVNDASDYHNYSVTGDYAFERWFKVSAGVTQYNQSRDATRNPYSGYSLNVAATFILD